MRIPRDLSRARLADALCQRRQYIRVHQVGSHIILETEEPAHQRIAIPDHHPPGLGRSFPASVLSPGTRV